MAATNKTGQAGEAAAWPEIDGFRVTAGVGVVYLTMDHSGGACTLVRLSDDGADYLAGFIDQALADDLRPCLKGLTVPFHMAAQMAEQLRGAHREEPQDLPPLFRRWSTGSVNTARSMRPRQAAEGHA